MKTAKVKAASKPFLALTAADLMTAPVKVIPQETSLKEAAHMLSGCHISGAPVVDKEGRCLGVLSSSDFVAWAEEPGETSATGKKVTCFVAPWGEMIDIEESADQEISRYMTPRPITVSPKIHIGDLAQKMVEAHIHRLLVGVEPESPCGIVTSTDILAAVAKEAKKAPRRD